MGIRKGVMVVQGNNYNLRPLWDAMLEIYEEIRKVCVLNNIEFFAAAGTLLGAVRHGGFIPWDDDMDLFFRLDQLEKFLRVAPKSLPPYLHIIKWGDGSGFSFLYVKVQDMRQEKINSVRVASGLPLSEGLFIDLFPFSGVPAHGVVASIKNAALRLRKSVILGGRKVTLKSKVGWLVGLALKPFFPRMRTPKDVIECQERYMHRIHSSTASMLGFYDGDLCRHIYCCEAAWYREVKWMKFDKTEVPIPIDYDKMLKVHYGDYMKLPPVEKRRVTHVDAPKATWKID